MDQLDEACDIALPRSASRCCDGTTAVECGVGPSTSETWSSASSRVVWTSISSLRCGRDRTCIAEVHRLGTYKLRTINGEVFINAWNIK